MSEDEKKKETINQDDLSFAERVDAAINYQLSIYENIMVCMTPQILLDVGCKNLPILYTQTHLRNALKPYNQAKHHHGLKVEQIKLMTEEISNPVMILDSAQRNDSLVIVTSLYNENGDPIIIPVFPFGRGHYQMDIATNFATSMYGRRMFADFLNNRIENDAVLYLNKEKSQEMFSVLGLQFPKCFNNFGSNTIIHQSRNIVKHFLTDFNNNFKMNEDGEWEKLDNTNFKTGGALVRQAVDPSDVVNLTTIYDYIKIERDPAEIKSFVGRMDVERFEKEISSLSNKYKASTEKWSDTEKALLLVSNNYCKGWVSKGLDEEETRILLEEHNISIPE